MNLADTKANTARQWADNANKAPQLIGCQNGYGIWMVGRTAILMPKLGHNAPKSVRRLYRDRLVCNATGACPRCSAAAEVDQRGANITHAAGCGVGMPELLEGWLD